VEVGNILLISDVHRFEKHPYHFLRTCKLAIVVYAFGVSARINVNKEQRPYNAGMGRMTINKGNFSLLDSRV
jgi:hypothetical protein